MVLEDHSHSSSTPQLTCAVEQPPCQDSTQEHAGILPAQLPHHPSELNPGGWVAPQHNIGSGLCMQGQLYY